jgi:(p)ppGpp synthase/HD superfamily hydrolase
MLAAISSAVSGLQANILDMSARTDEERGVIDMTVQIPDMKHLEKVISSVRQLEGVYDVMRSPTGASKPVANATKVGKE